MLRPGGLRPCRFMVAAIQQWDLIPLKVFILCDWSSRFWLSPLLLKQRRLMVTMMIMRTDCRLALLTRSSSSLAGFV